MQVGAGAERQASSFGCGIRVRRPHNNCLTGPFLLDAAEQVFAADAGKRQVQEHKVRVLAQRGREPFGTGGCLGDGESGCFERPGGETADVEP